MNKHLYLCHPLVLSSPTLMMHGHMNLKFKYRHFSQETRREDITIPCVGVNRLIILKCRVLSFELDLASLWYDPLVGFCEGPFILRALATLDCYIKETWLTALAFS